MSKINIVNPENPQFDQSKINIWSFVYNKNPKLIDSMNQHGLNESTRIFARQCSFEKIPKDEAISFLNQNHIKGAFTHQHGFGLFYFGELVAVMTFGKCRYNNQFDWEIIRYACLQSFTVVGGAGKLLSGAIRELQSDSIFSYSENMIGVGNLYQKLGFEFMGETGPGFFWYKNGVAINRQMASRFHLAKMFPTETEVVYSTPISQFMKSKGYIQVYDMGNKRWGMNPKSSTTDKKIKAGELTFIQENGEIICVSEPDFNPSKKINLRKIQCREMVKDEAVRLIPTSLINDFIEQGWRLNSKKPGNSGMVKIKKGDETKFIRLEELDCFEKDGWAKSNTKNKDGKKKFTRAPSTNGKVSIKKDGVKRMVTIDEAHDMVKNHGWELGAASCWRLASDEVKKLGRELGYDI